ncbi:unnamed protein product, partial [marine sediment metagenome]
MEATEFHYILVMASIEIEGHVLLITLIGVSDNKNFFYKPLFIFLCTGFLFSSARALQGLVWSPEPPCHAYIFRGPDIYMALFSFMFAPMEGYSDCVLRTLCHTHGADLTFTEMAHVESFLRGNKPALAKIEASDSTPVQIQLLTGREDKLERFVEGFRPFPGFKGFNLNLSCPSMDVIRHGKGAAMVKRA